MPARADGPVVSARQAAALLLAGLLLRLVALPLPGTGDVLIWKTWSYNAVMSGETAAYGVGGHPPERRELRYRGDFHVAIDYPPLAVFALGAAGRAYHRLSPEMRDAPGFTVFVKLPSLFAEIGLAWLMYVAARRMAGREAGRIAMLACWLNPALLLCGSALGYLDPLFVLPAVAALVAAAAGRTWVTGALLAAATLTKAQGALLAPVIALGVVRATRPASGRRLEAIALGLGETAAAAALTTVVVLWPFAAAGTLPNAVAGMRSLAEHDMLSGNAANVWWIATWLIRSFDALPDVGAWQAFTTLPRILAISVARDLGYPNPRVVGLVMTGSAWAWAIWRARRARDFGLLAGVAAFLVHAYFVLAAQVHENHLLLAIPLAVLAAGVRPEWGRVATALTGIQALNLNLFYGLSERVKPNLAIPRSVTLVDAVVVLAVLNVVALGWHAAVLGRWTALPRARGPEPGTPSSALKPAALRHDTTPTMPRNTPCRFCAPFVAAAMVAALSAAGCSQAARLDAKCVAGDVATCTQLGDMYANGRGVPRDMARAGQSYERACAGGVADVCNTLGEIIEVMGMVEGGSQRAEQYFQKACQGGSSPGCLNLGLAAAAREEFTLAVSLYERSCDGGWAPGCHQLGQSYEQGEGVQKDLVKAISLYGHACDGEFVDSCVLLGNLYASGDSVPKDNVLAVTFYGKAFKLYQESCTVGNAGDCTERDRLRTRIVLVSAAPPPPAPQPAQPAIPEAGPIK